MNLSKAAEGLKPQAGLVRPLCTPLGGQEQGSPGPREPHRLLGLHPERKFPQPPPERQRSQPELSAGGGMLERGGARSLCKGSLGVQGG